MSGAYGFSAADSVTGAIYAWTLGTIDFSGAGYPGPNSPVNQRLVAASNQGPAGAAGAGANPAPDYVATSNVVLNGSQTVDGATPATGKVVLCIAQTNPVENGYQVVNTAGAWSRPGFYNSDATVAATLGIGTGLILSGATYAGSQWFLKSGNTIAGAKVYRRVIPGVTLYMPPPNGVNDLPAFTALLSELTGVGGTIQFQSGLYKSPTGFFLNGSEGIHIRGVSASISGVPSTTMSWTGARASKSACFRMQATNNCSIAHVGFVSTVSGPEYGCLIGGNGSTTDADNCHVFDCQAYGNAAAAPLTTSTTSINVSTCVNTTVAITLAAATVPYLVGTQLTLCSRGGSGILHGLITASSGTAVSFIPTDAFGTGTHTDWDVLQAMNGVNVGSSELCGVYRTLCTLCYDGIRMGGVGGLVEATCSTNSPLGPSFRVGDFASYVKIFGNAEFNANYQWTIALHVDGAVNLEASVGMGDGYTLGIPYILKNISVGDVHGLNATGPAGGTVMSVDTCSGLKIHSVYGDCAGGSFVQNVGSNSNCSIDALFAHSSMSTFVGGVSTGFTHWNDVATAKFNLGTARAQTLEALFGVILTPGAMSLANGANNHNISLVTGLNIVTGPTGAFALDGLAPPLDGHEIVLVYFGTQTFTLLHNNAGSTAGNKLACPGGADLVLVPPASGFLYIPMVYSASALSGAGGWIVKLPTQTTPIRVASGATDTITAADAGFNIQYTNAAGCAITLNTLPAGFSCLCSQEAAGALTFVNGTSAKQTAIAGAGATTAQYQARYLFWSDATHTRIT